MGGAGFARVRDGANRHFLIAQILQKPFPVPQLYELFFGFNTWVDVFPAGDDDWGVAVVIFIDKSI